MAALFSTSQPYSKPAVIQPFTSGVKSSATELVKEHLEISKRCIGRILICKEKTTILTVLDLASWVRIAVLMNVCLGLGNSGGVGILE